MEKILEKVYKTLLWSVIVCFFLTFFIGPTKVAKYVFSLKGIPEGYTLYKSDDNMWTFKDDSGNKPYKDEIFRYRFEAITKAIFVKKDNDEKLLQSKQRTWVNVNE